MSKNFFQTQIIIFGLVGYILDVLKAKDNSKEIKDNLLLAILTTFTSKLLSESSEVAEVAKKILADSSSLSSYEQFLGQTQKYFHETQPDVDPSPLLKASAREVLDDFLSQAQKPELSEQINGLLQ